MAIPGTFREVLVHPTIPHSTVYLDESGFTGIDMLNPDQPVFTHASVSLSHDEASELLRETLGRLRPGSDEFSHSVIAKTPEGQKRIANLVGHLAGLESQPVVYHMIYKRFALLAKLIDNWVEPMMHREGYNLLADGGAVAYLNMVWVCLRAFEGADRFDALLVEYQRFTRNATANGFKRFFDFVASLLESSVNADGQEILQTLLYSSRLGVHHLDSLGAAANDVAYPAVFSTIAYWDARFNSTFAIVHDQSKNLNSVIPMLQAVMNDDERSSRQEVGFDATLTYTLPFRTAGISFADSRQHPQLQVADIVAGAAAAVGRYAVDRSRKPAYAEQLVESGIDQLRYGWIWPNLEDIKRRPSVGPGISDPLEVSARLISKASG